MSAPSKVVVIGGGVAGATVSLLLARAGQRVWMLERPNRIDPLVGESLLPAAVPILRKLGVEDDVRVFATLKPGVAFIMRNRRTLSFRLERLRGMTCTYSYNVPRPQFDEMLRSRAVETGVQVVEGTVRVDDGDGRVLLDGETLGACGLDDQPDFVVDCSGRAQVLRRKLGIGGRPGKRCDTCLFAHFRNVDLGVPQPGFAVITLMSAGWSWRIPLPGLMSVGIVVDTDRLRSFGSTPAERLRNVLESDQILSLAMAGAERVSEVRVFNNYQWVTDHFAGENWAMVGDAAGFVDPTLSSGVLLALQGATAFAKVFVDRGRPLQVHLARWERRTGSRSRRGRNWSTTSTTAASLR